MCPPLPLSPHTRSPVSTAQHMHTHTHTHTERERERGPASPARPQNGGPQIGHETHRQKTWRRTLLCEWRHTCTCVCSSHPFHSFLPLCLGRASCVIIGLDGGVGWGGKVSCTYCLSSLLATWSLPSFGGHGKNQPTMDGQRQRCGKVQQAGCGVLESREMNPWTDTHFNK